MIKMIPARRYIQRGADHSLEHPGLGFKGWTDIEVPVDPEHTAIIVMHAWDMGTQQTQPVSWDTVEYIERAEKITAERFPGFLEKVRASGIRLIHVGAGWEKGFEDLPGYRRVAAECPPETIERVPVEDEAAKALWQLRLGPDDDQLVKELYAREFAIKARDDEDVIKTSGQLFHLCKKTWDHPSDLHRVCGQCLSGGLCRRLCGHVPSRRDLLYCVRSDYGCREQGKLRGGTEQGIRPLEILHGRPCV